MSNKKAKKQAKKATKHAEKATSHATGHATERAADLAERTGALVHTGASELAGKLRHSDALEKASSAAGELGDRALKAWHESGMDDRTGELAEKVRDSEAAHRASERTRHLTDAGLATLGGWLATGPVAEKLGVKPKRTWPVWVLGLIGVGIGFAVGRLTAPRPGVDVRNDLASAADRLATKASSVLEDATDQASDVADDAVAAAEVAAETVRSALDRDKRTASLPSIDVDVADGTVFIRGTVPVDVDEGVIRDVVGAIPGVRDVDLNLTKDDAS